MPIAFTPDLLKDASKFRAYVDEKKQETIDTIRSEIVEGNVRAEPQWRGHKVVWLAIGYPFLAISILFAQILMVSSQAVGASSFAFKCRIYIERTFRDLSLIGDVIRHGENLLVPSFNFHNDPVYDQPPIAYDQCAREIQRIATQESAKNNKIRFKHPGLCQAMCIWFHYLFETMKHEIADQRLLAVLIARQFIDGGDEITTILRSCNFSRDDWLGVHLGNPFGTNNNDCGISDPAIHLQTHRAKLLTEWESLSPGSYEILLTSTKGKHTMNFIVLPDRSILLFDPEMGLIDCKTQRFELIFQQMDRWFAQHPSSNATLSLFSAKAISAEPAQN